MEESREYTDKNGVRYREKPHEKPVKLGKPVTPNKYGEEVDMEVVTIDKLKELFPKKKGAITQEIVDIINTANKDPEFQGESILSTMVLYEDIMLRNKASFKEFIRAIKFCSYLTAMKDNTVQAYIKTFYDRKFVQERKNQPTDSNRYKELCNAAGRYRRTKLVTDLLTISQVPLDMMFMGYRYKAIGVLADRMENARLDRDRIAAAKELLAATEPKEKKIELEIGPSASAVEQQDKLFDQLRKISYNQKVMMETGGRLEDIQRLGIDIVDVEAE